MPNNLLEQPDVSEPESLAARWAKAAPVSNTESLAARWENAKPVESEGLLRGIGKAAIQGATAFPKAFWGTGAALEDVAYKAFGGSDETKNLSQSGFMRRNYDAVSNLEKDFEPQQVGIRKNITDAARTVTQMGSSALGTAGLGTLPAMAIGAGVDKYLQSRDEGYSVPRSASAGVSTGAIEYLTEQTPIKILSKPGLSFIKRLAGGLVADVPGELAATAIEMKAVDEGILGKSYTTEQYKRALIDTAITSGLVTGAATAAVHPFNRRADDVGKEPVGNDTGDDGTGLDFNKLDEDAKQADLSARFEVAKPITMPPVPEAQGNKGSVNPKIITPLESEIGLSKADAGGAAPTGSEWQELKPDAEGRLTVPRGSEVKTDFASGKTFIKNKTIKQPKGVIQFEEQGQAETGQVAPTETRVLPEEQAAITAIKPEAFPAMAATPSVTTTISPDISRKSELIKVYRASDKPYNPKLITEDGVYVSLDKQIAGYFKSKGRIIEELNLNLKDAKILKYEDIPQEIKNIKDGSEYNVKVAKYGRQEGYDIVQSTPEETMPSGKKLQLEYTILNPKIIEQPTVEESLRVEPRTVGGLKERGSKPAKWLEKTGTTKTILNKEERELLRDVESTTPEILNEVRDELSKPNIVQEIKTKVASKIKIDQSLKDHFPSEEYGSLLKAAPNLFSIKTGVSFDEIADGLGITTDELADKLKNFNTNKGKLESAKQMVEDYKDSRVDSKVATAKRPLSKIKQTKFEYDKTKVVTRPKMESSFTNPALQTGQKSFLKKGNIQPKQKPAAPSASMASRKLPAELSKATPRYNYGTKVFLPQFESDIDKALYITAQPKKSARDDDYRRFLIEQGFNDEEIRTYGAIVRGEIKEMAGAEEGGTQAEPQALMIQDYMFSTSEHVSPVKSVFDKLRDETGAVGDLKSGFYDKIEIALRSRQPDKSVPLTWWKKYANEILGVSTLPPGFDGVWRKLISTVDNKAGYDLLGGMSREEVQRNRDNGEYTGWKLTKSTNLELFGFQTILEKLESFVKSGKIKNGYDSVVALGNKIYTGGGFKSFMHDMKIALGNLWQHYKSLVPKAWRGVSRKTQARINKAIAYERAKGVVLTEAQMKRVGMSDADIAALKNHKAQLNKFIPLSEMQNPVVRSTLEFWAPTSTLPDSLKYNEMRNKSRGDIARIEQLIGKVMKKTKGFSVDTNKKLFQFLDGKLKLDGLPKEVRRYAITLRGMNRRIGLMLVNRGLITPQAWAEHKDQYIRYIYLKHMLDESGIPTTGGKINAAALKGRIDPIIKSVDDEGVYQVVSAGGKAYSAPTLTLNEAKARQAEVQKGVDKYRKAIGLVEDVSVAEPVSLSVALQNSAAYDKLSEIADNPDWVWQPSVITVEGSKWGIGALEEEVKMQAKLVVASPESTEIKKRYDMLNNGLEKAMDKTGNVPSDFIALPKTAAYGKLSGMFVKKPIYRDLVPIFSGLKGHDALSRTVNTLIKIETDAMALFKISKTALNIPTMIRNTVSNMVQLNLSGIPIYDIPGYAMKALTSMIKKDESYTKAFRSGLFKSNFVEGELLEIYNNFQAMNKNSWFDIVGQVSKLAKFYGKIDDVFKMAKYIERIETGVPHGEAVVEANKWGMDYSAAHPSIKYLRRHILPMGSYSYKIMPLILESMVKRPWVIAKYLAIPSVMMAIAKASLDLSDDDWDELRKRLRFFLKKSSSLVPLPFKNENGDPQWVDLEYFFPGQMMLAIYRDLRNKDGWEVPRDIGMSNPLVELLFQLPASARGTGIPKDPFTGKELYNALDEPSTKVFNTLEWIYNKWMPTMLTRYGTLGKVAEIGKTNRYGETGDVGNTALSLAGIKVMSPTEEQTGLELAAKLKQLETYYYRGVTAARGDEKKIDSLTNNYEKQLKELMDEK